MNVLGIGLVMFQLQLGSASGIVTKPGGTEPLPGATVTLSPAVSSETILIPGAGVIPGADVPGQNPRVRTAITQDDGRFILSDIEPGDYRLEVQSARYGGAAYGQRKPNGPGAVLTIASGQRLSDLRLSIVPTGVIAGRITGPSGEPIVYAGVQALKYLYQDGKRVLSVVQTTTTDDRGDYRLFWLTGGKYVVVAATRSSPANSTSPPPLKPGITTLDRLVLTTEISLISSAQLDGTNLVKRILEDGTVREESWLPTYYPGTTDRAGAATIEVSAGSTVPGVNITVGPSPVQKIRGRATGFATQATVALASAAPGGSGTGLVINNKGASTIDGSFEFAGILPGPYYLTARDRSGLVATPVAVLVGDRDVDGVTVTAVPGITVSARIVAEGATPGPIDPLTELAGMLRPELGTLPVTPQTSPRGAISPGSNVMVFPNVPPGEYQFSIAQGALRENLKRLHIKSVRLGQEDALATVHVTSNTTNVLLDVVLTTLTGSVEGVALGRAGDPAGNATVVLVPAAARNRLNLYQVVVTGNDGKFRFQEIPPGDYKLFAWDDIETGAWADAEFLRAYESRGVAVRISENSKEDARLNVIYNP